LALLVLLEPQALLQLLLSARPQQEPQELTHLLLTRAHRLLRFLTSPFLVATLDLLAQQEQMVQLAPQELQARLQPLLLVQQLQETQEQTHL